MKNVKVTWTVTFENIKGNKVVKLNSCCKKGSPEDTEEYWKKHWEAFLKENASGWAGYRIVSIKRQVS